MPGEPWICLPDLTPDQVRVARLSVRCMSGDLDAEVMSLNTLYGNELITVVC